MECLNSALYPLVLEPLMNDLSVPQHWSGQQQGVDAIEDAAMTG
jgi:hypothetical protein